MRKGSTTPQKKQNIKTEKTLKELAADGLVWILKQIGAEDEKAYYIIKDKAGKEVHTLDLLGSEQEMQVNGSARIGFFDTAKGNQHFIGKNGKGIKVDYQFTGKVNTDSWGLKIIVVLNWNIEGLDEYQK